MSEYIEKGQEPQGDIFKLFSLLNQDSRKQKVFNLQWY